MRLSGFSQLVREPIRKQYLLDLAICDLVGAKATVLSIIADHKGARIDIPMPVISEVGVARTVWHLNPADWEALQKELTEVDWSILNRGVAEDAVQYFLDVVWTLLVKHIPQKKIECKRSSHPWLNSRCCAAIIQTKSTEGPDNYKDAQKSCDDVLREERTRYVEELNNKLSKPLRSSKQRWRIDR